MAPQLSFGAGGGHVGVPKVAADIVDDLGSGFDGRACGAGVEGVNGEDGLGALFEDGFDDGEDAGLLFVGGEGGGVGAGGFAADVEDVAPSSSILRAWASALSGAFCGE